MKNRRGDGRDVALFHGDRWGKATRHFLSQLLCTLLATLIATGPVSQAFAIESGSPTETFTFSDTTPAARGASRCHQPKGRREEP